MSYDYTRYLAAKTTVDDRALNRQVLSELRRLIPSTAPRVLEIGAGLGTMVARLLDWGVIEAGEYTLLDVDDRLLHDSRQWLEDWAGSQGLRSEPSSDGMRIGGLRVRFVHAELGHYLDASHIQRADVLIANALLDLVDVPTVLPGLLRSLAPGGVYWFTINYDGESIFSPAHARDGQIMRACHQDMDERVRYGRPAGDSRTGRHLFHHLRDAGAPALVAGSSDWIVHAQANGAYPRDEAYFLGSILRTVADALEGRMNPVELAQWVDERERQLASGELLYIAHQLDFLGRSPA
jgi:SAM-dependent methyltransferase